MKSTEFEEVNVRIAENQEEYQTLPAHFNAEEGSFTFCFELDKEEMKQIKETGKIWFKQLTFGQPMNPIMMSTLKKDLIC
jgi:hypothetical protein